MKVTFERSELITKHYEKHGEEFGDITGYSAPKGYEKSMSYMAHARRTLMKLAAQDSLLEKYTVKWY